MRYRRVPHRVRAEWLVDEWTCVTANGSPVRAATGGNRLTDADSAAQWSIAPGALRHGYVEVAPGEYQSRGEVTADRVDGAAHRSVATLECPVVAHPGDWVVTAADGSQLVVVDSWFRDRYEPVPPGLSRW